MKNNRKKIIILAGQSNAVGVAHNKYLPMYYDSESVKTFTQGYENILMNYFSHNMRSDGFVKTAVNCSEKGRETFGPEIGIARALTKKYPEEKFYIIKCAVGGTNIFYDWLPPSCKGEYRKESFAEGDTESEFYHGGGWCFNELVKILGESIKTLEDQGYEPQISAFFWMQGESDALSTDTVEKYGMRYEALLSDLGEIFKGYFEDCVYVDAGISEIWQYYKEINSWKKKHAEETKNSYYIDTIGEGLTTLNEPVEEPDIAHYDCCSTIRLGELFAEKI